MEKTLVADISSLRKTGHFYFALTAIEMSAIEMSAELYAATPVSL
jgi:hypothetical protein